jgi:hypothetical protein
VSVTGQAWRQSLIRDLIEPVQSNEPASALGSHVQEFAFSGDVPGFRIIEGKGPAPISCGAGRRAATIRPLKERTLTGTIRGVTPRQMSPMPPQPASESSGNDSEVSSQAPLLTKREVTV